ncbi:LADA_0D02586g1_1 [Lachancea dasiensis]|uniref:Endoplasmic reticulum lectin n=1 Tax=Lachancea dasiensis TaxID=1072105 RepID=A0A1G4J517_9SACH|nr:LADA_0D02586g1_1 [Lachancea dasiensis]
MVAVRGSVVLMLTAFVWGFNSLDDSFTLPKYSIQYVSPTIFQRTILNNNAMLENGELVDLGNSGAKTCYKPHIRPEEVASDSCQLELLAQEELQQSTKIIQESLEGQCFNYFSGIWRYTYCHGQSITQDQNMPAQEVGLHFLLGQLADEGLQEPQMLNDVTGYYVSERAVNGDMCTEIHAGREVEVKYVCDSGSSQAFISDVKEVMLCHYVMTIAIPNLCHLQLLSAGESKKSAHPIVCADSNPVNPLTTSRFQPFFLGQGFYFLQNRYGSGVLDGQNVSKLLYIDDVIFSEDDSGLHPSEDLFLERAVKAFQELTTKGLLAVPGTQAFSPGDTLSWVSEVVDNKGNSICILKVKVGEDAVAQLTFDRMSSGSSHITENVIQYTRATIQEPNLVEDFPETIAESSRRDRTFDVNVKKDAKIIEEESMQAFAKNLAMHLNMARGDSEEEFEVHIGPAILDRGNSGQTDHKKQPVNKAPRDRGSQNEVEHDEL